MPSMVQRFTRSVRAITLALALALVVQGAPARLQQVAPEIARAGHRDAVIAVAQYTSHRGLIDQLLRDAGFTPAVLGWDGFPVLRKVETAYLSAERAGAGQGGMLLATLARGVNREYAAAGYHPALAQLIGERAFAGPLSFAVVSSVPQTWRPSLQARQQILAISYYAEGGAIGGPQGVLQQYFELSDENVYDILRTSNTTAEAIERGLAYVPEAERNPRLATLARDVMEAYPNAKRDARIIAIVGVASAGRDSTLNTPPVHPPENRGPGTTGGGVGSPGGDGFRPPDAGGSRRVWTPPPPQPNRPGGTGVRPQGGGFAATNDGAPGAAARAAARFTEAESGWFANAAAAGFQVAAAVLEGPGGVMFGDRVSVDPNLPALKSVTWTQPPGSRVGSLEFVFVSGPPRVVSGLRADHVLGALRLIYSGVAGVAPKREGDAIPLISLEDRIETPICDADAERSRTEWQVIVHPAIADLEVGHDLLGADLLPTDTTIEHLLDTTEQRLGRAARQSLMKPFEDLSPETWKLTDVPLEIAATAAGLEVRRADRTGIDARLARTAFFTMHAYKTNRAGQGERIEAFSSQFYPLVPALTKATREYESMNGFARTMALLRWARMQNAPVVGTPVVARTNLVPEAIHVTGSGYTAVRSTANTDARRLQLLDQQLNRYPNAPLAQYLAEQQQLRRAIQSLPPSQRSKPAQELVPQLATMPEVARAAAIMDRLKKQTPQLPCLAHVRGERDVVARQAQQ